MPYQCCFPRPLPAKHKKCLAISQPISCISTQKIIKDRIIFGSNIAK